MQEAEFREHVVAALARIETDVGGLRRDVDDVRDDLYGNGDSGLKERMATLEERSPPSRKGVAAWAGGLGGVLGSVAGFFLSKV